METNIRYFSNENFDFILTHNYNNGRLIIINKSMNKIYMYNYTNKSIKDLINEIIDTEKFIFTALSNQMYFIERTDVEMSYFNITNHIESNFELDRNFKEKVFDYLKNQLENQHGFYNYISFSGYTPKFEDLKIPENEIRIGYKTRFKQIMQSITSTLDLTVKTYSNEYKDFEHNTIEFCVFLSKN